MILHSYNRGTGIKALRDALEKRGEHTLVLNRKPVGRHPVVVCWGSAPIKYPRQGLLILNPPEVTTVVSNKLRFFQHVSDITEVIDPWPPEYPLPCLQWTTNPEETKEWPLTVVRHVLAGSGGEGIELVEKGQEVPKAPLYTKYQKKSSEFRLHVFKVNGEFEILHVQKKTAKEGQEADFKIRNAKNGFVFQQHGFDTPGKVTDLAVGFMRDYFPGIDFVALDVIYSKKEDRAWVLEGNTAPGLQGKTVDVYADYLLERKKLQ